MDELDSILKPEGTDPMIGRVLSQRYRVDRRLGKGGMGVVYEATHLMIEKKVAVKLMHADLAGEAEAVKRFRREAIAAGRLDHPNIVEVSDMGRADDGAVFMVLELLDGRDWGEEIERQGVQSLEKTVHIVSQVCSALQAAHDAGILHRDLKPENVFLIRREADDAFVKVVDFGISKILDASTKLSRTGSAMGTPYFMSPEQLRGQSDLDARTDVYAVGVMIFNALTCRYPFEASTLPLLAVKALSEPPPPLRSLRPDLPEGLEALVARMLAKDREERPSSCAEVEAELAAFADAPERASAIDALASTAHGAPASTPDVAAQVPDTHDGLALARTAAAPSVVTEDVPPEVEPRPGAEEPAAKPRPNVALIGGGVALALVAVAAVGVVAWPDPPPEETVVDTVEGPATDPIAAPDPTPEAPPPPVEPVPVAEPDPPPRDSTDEPAPRRRRRGQTTVAAAPEPAAPDPRPAETTPTDPPPAPDPATEPASTDQADQHASDSLGSLRGPR